MYYQFISGINYASEWYGQFSIHWILHWYLGKVNEKLSVCTYRNNWRKTFIKNEHKYRRSLKSEWIMNIDEELYMFYDTR